MQQQTFYSPLSTIAQKTLLQQIERTGGIDRYRNKQYGKEQLIKPLLDKLPDLFGKRGDPRRRQAAEIVKYWYNFYYKENKYNELLRDFDIASRLDSARIHRTPHITSRLDSARIQSTPPANTTREVNNITINANASPSQPVSKEKYPNTLPHLLPSTTITPSKMKDHILSKNALEFPEHIQIEGLSFVMEEGHAINNGSKSVDYLVISLPISDPDDYTEGRHGLVIAEGNRLIVKIPKHRQSQYNTVGLYGEELAASHVANKHKEMGARMKTLIRNGKEDELVHMFAIRLPWQVTNKHTTNSSTGILMYEEGEWSVSWAGEKTLKVQEELKTQWKLLAKTGVKVPLLSLEFRVAIPDTLKLLEVSMESTTDYLAQLSMATKSMSVVVDPSLASNVDGVDEDEDEDGDEEMKEEEEDEDTERINIEEQRRILAEQQRQFEEDRREAQILRDNLMEERRQYDEMRLRTEQEFVEKLKATNDAKVHLSKTVSNILTEQRQQTAQQQEENDQLRRDQEAGKQENDRLRREQEAGKQENDRLRLQQQQQQQQQVYSDTQLVQQQQENDRLRREQQAGELVQQKQEQENDGLRLQQQQQQQQVYSDTQLVQQQQENDRREQEAVQPQQQQQENDRLCREQVQSSTHATTTEAAAFVQPSPPKPPKERSSPKTPKEREYTTDRSDYYEMQRGEGRKERANDDREGRTIKTGVQKDKRANAHLSRLAKKRDEQILRRRISGNGITAAAGITGGEEGTAAAETAGGMVVPAEAETTRNEVTTTPLRRSLRGQRTIIQTAGMWDNIVGGALDMDRILAQGDAAETAMNEE